LSFWAAYCEPCVKELPYIEQFLANKKTNVKVNFIHICIDNDLESCKSILNKISPPGDYIYCSRDQMEYLNAYYFPFGLLFDKNKNLVGGFNGLNALFNYLIKK
jgi:thiol-disulfide isomerase/thioredoxin